MKKRNGKQWSALVLSWILLLAGMGLWFSSGSQIMAALLFVVFLIWIGLLSFLAIGRAWAVGQDLLAFTSSALVIIALLPLLFTPLLGSEWLQTGPPSQDRSISASWVQEEIDLINDLREAFTEFDFQKTPLLLRLYLLAVAGAILSVAATLFVPRPSQKLPRVGRWLETCGMISLGLLFLVAILVTSGLLEAEPFIRNMGVLFIGVLLLGSLVAYYRFGSPVLGLAVPGEIPKAPANKKPSATQKEALRRRGQEVRSQAPANLPDLTKQSLAAAKVEPEPEPVRAPTNAPPGSPGSLEPGPNQKKKPVSKPSRKKQPVPTKPGWYPDPFSSSGERYWDGARWGQQTKS